jgi:nickel/cobalt exporter
VRRLLIAAAALAAAGLGALWLWGDGLADAAVAAQRAAQNRMAGVLRALRGGQPGALATLVGLGFLYGVLHAAGPGHGKLLIGGWSLGRPVSAARVLAVSLVSSLAQAAVAVALVLGLAVLLGWDRQRLTGLADGTLVTAGTWAVLAIGVWLVLRGVLALVRGGRGHVHHHDHDHDHDHGHAHVAGPADVARAVTLPEQAALVAAVAVRPCSGALVLMALTLAMGIPMAGVAATFAMGLGTFATVAGAGLLAAVLRQGTLASLPDSGALRLGLPALELVAGVLLAAASALVLLGG